MTLTEAQAMTPEERRVKLAELMGYKPHKGFEGERWIDPQGKMSVTRFHGMPDYCNDLNAVHNVEQTLTREQEIAYQEWLFQAGTREARVASKYLWHATADQRTTALILTLSQA